MKKLLVVIALTVSIGLLAGLYAQPASAFFNGLPFFGNSAKSCNVPVCAPVCGYYCCPPAYCKPAKMKAKANAKGVVKEKKVKKEIKQKKETK